MREYENLHPVNEMERISRKELCERFDEVLDKVDKDDIGFVITDGGKRIWYYVLQDGFHFNWMMISDV